MTVEAEISRGFFFGLSRQARFVSHGAVSSGVARFFSFLFGYVFVTAFTKDFENIFLENDRSPHKQK